MPRFIAGSSNLLLTLLIVINGLTPSAQNLPSDSLYARQILKELCGKKYFGRGYLNNGLDKAAKYLSASLRKFEVKPLFNTGYFQWFDFNVNTFPGKMKVLLNGKLLKPGEDYILNAGSIGQKGEYKVQKVDSVNYVDRETGPYPLALSVKEKLTYDVAQKAEPFTIIEILKGKVEGKSANLTVDIENKVLTKYVCKNVCGFIPGKENDDSCIVFSAHYDHLGGMGSANWFPGANDNASGVSMVLNLARYYHLHPHKYRMVFLFFAGEEAGLLGSKYFTENQIFDLKKIKFLVNLDLLGTGEEGITVVNATEYKWQFELLRKINDENKFLTLVKPRGKAQNSDHYWFSELGVPCFFIYTMGGIKAYHDVFDKPETLPLTKYKNVIKLLEQFVSELTSGNAK